MIDLVAGVLAEAGISSPPVRTPFLARSLGIVIEAYWDAPREYDASLVCCGTKKLCWYNPRKIDTRTRFSVAHEIGHLFLHDCRWTGELPAYDDAMEREADAFAAELLMPTRWMLEICLEHPSFDDLRNLFWVSKQAMKWRLCDLGLYIPITRYEEPSISPWPVLQPEIGREMYRPWPCRIVTGDPYGDYLLARGVVRPTSEATSTTSDVGRFPCDTSTDPSPVIALSSV